MTFIHFMKYKSLRKLYDFGLICRCYMTVLVAIHPNKQYCRYYDIYCVKCI